MHTRQIIVPLRVSSFVTALLFSWSLILASTVRAAVDRPLLPSGHSRALSAKEMAQITGATPVLGGGDGGGSGGSGGTYNNPAATPGPAYPWEGSVGGVKVGNGNKLTSVGIVGWTQLGGRLIDLTLNHNSESSRNGELGSKWLMSYDDTLSVDGSGNVTIYWGDGRVYTFMKNVDGSYTTPPGVHDFLNLFPANRLIGAHYRLFTKNYTMFNFTVTANPNVYSLFYISNLEGNQTSFGYVSGTNLIQTITDASGRKITLGYTNSKLTSVTDPLARQWTLSYDGSGNLAHIYWPAVNGTTYTVNLGYDGNHNVNSYQDRRGSTSKFSYNSDNTLAWEQDPYGSQTSFAYGFDAVSNSNNASAVTITDSNKHKTVYYVGSAGQVTTWIDALTYREAYSYDSGYNVIQRRDRNQNLWNYTFDGMGNVLTAKDPYGNTSTMTYNTYSSLLTAQTPLGRSISVTYNSYDNPTQVQQKDTSGNIIATTNYTIDTTANSHTFGLLTDKYDANNHHTAYTYDANGYLASTTTPLGHKTQWTYDALGFQTTRTDAMSRTTTYTPDAWERLVTTTYPDNSTHTFAYDANSNLTTWTDPNTGPWFRTYDGDNRVLTEGDYTTAFVSHTYDAAGQKGLLSTTTDYYGRVLSYAYSARNELAGVSEAAGTETYAYDPNGNQLHRYLPNGLRTDQYYNADGTLDSFYDWNGASTIYESFGYDYNADHQMTGYNEGNSNNVHATANPTNISYGYDALGHLTSDTRTGSLPYSRTYTVDGANNRLTMNENGAVTTLFHDGDDELNSCSGTGAYGYTYNANGDQITSTVNGQGTTYAYDFDDQLVGITKSGSTTTFQYDALGRQIRRAVNALTTTYYLDGGQVLFETQNGSETAQYTWGNGLIRRNGEYPLTDGVGTTKLTTNGSRVTTSTQETEAFGRTIGTTGSTGSAFGYHGAAGYRQDGDGPAGLEPYQKVGARYYDATFGRFITRDTELSQSPYAYCNGDPVNCTDPSGHLSAVNIAAGAMVISGTEDGSENAPVDTSGDNKSSSSSSGSSGGTSDGKTNLSGTYGLHTVTQGGKTTGTATVNGTSGRTTFGGNVVFTFDPVHFVSGSLNLGYKASSNFSGTLKITPGTSGSPTKYEVNLDGKF